MLLGLIGLGFYWDFEIVKDFGILKCKSGCDVLGVFNDYKSGDIDNGEYDGFEYG